VLFAITWRRQQDAHLAESYEMQMTGDIDVTQEDMLDLVEIDRTNSDYRKLVSQCCRSCQWHI